MELASRGFKFLGQKSDPKDLPFDLNEIGSVLVEASMDQDLMRVFAKIQGEEVKNVRRTFPPTSGGQKTAD